MPCFSEQLVPLLNEAAQHYAAVAEAFHQLQDRFPFPGGGDPHQEEEVKEAIKLLQKAKMEEEAGVRIVAAMAGFLRSKLESELSPSHPLPVHIPISPFYSFGGKRFETTEKDPIAYQLDAVVVQCSDLRRSLRFYSRLLGMNVIPDMEDGPIGVLPLSSNDGSKLILTDARLDLIHQDWLPSVIVRSNNITKAYETMRQQRWEIIYPLDQGGVNVHFFVAADPDGHQIMVTSGSFSFSSISGRASDSPVKPDIDRVCLAVKDVRTSREMYTQLFSASWVVDELELIHEFNLSVGDTRIGFRTQDIKRTWQWIKEMNVPILNAPGDIGGESVGIVISDPDGNRIAIRDYSRCLSTVR